MKKNLDKVYVEDAVEKSILSLGWMIDYCNEKLDNPKFTHLFECPGGCGNKWIHGGDDSTFDFIPNGIHTIVWIAKIMAILWDHEINDYRELVMEKDLFRRNNDIPPIQDCVPKEIRKKIIALAYRVGYTVHDMNNAGLDEVIHEFDFKKIKEDLVNDPEEYQDEEGYYYKSKYLGSVMDISPSGKYYTPLASNVTEEDVIIDQIFWEKLEEDAEKEDIIIIHGEGDPTDVFAVWYVDKPDEEESADEVAWNTLFAEEIALNGRTH